VDIAPGKDLWVTGCTYFRFDSFQWAVKDLGSSCLRVTGVVQSVEFADDSSWKLNSIQEADALARADRNDTAPNCQESPLSDSDLKLFENAGLGRIYGNLHADGDNGAQSFWFPCFIVQIDDPKNPPKRLQAVCDTGPNH